MIRVLVAAETRCYREGLSSVLERRAHLSVVATARDDSELERLTETLSFDVVLLDTAMPQGNQIAAMLSRSAPQAKVLALLMRDQEESVIKWAEAGVSGFVSPDASIDELAKAIRNVVTEGAHCSQRAALILLRHVARLAKRPRPGSARLTVREAQILNLLGEGLSNKEIALTLFIEVPTVKNHVHRIFEKLGVNGRSDAIARLRNQRDATLVY